MTRNILYITYLLLFLSSLQPLSLFATEGKMAVIVSKSPSLEENEKHTLQNIIADVFSSQGYVNIDSKTYNKMLEDEITNALLLGNEAKINAIQQKYQVDVIADVTVNIESISAIAGYTMASASVSISCQRQDTAILFDQKVSQPQNGYYGMPEWIGTTRESARKTALIAAVSDIFHQIGITSVQMPLPPALKFELLPTNKPANTYFDNANNTINEKEAREFISSSSHGKWERYNITANQLDKNGRILTVGITRQDIDLQRRRRLDTSSFAIFDHYKKRLLREFELPARVAGIRRPKSKNIVDFSYAPGGRFLAIVSDHPVVWLYDILNGTILTQKPLDIAPRSIQFSPDGQYLQIQGARKTSYFQIK